MRRYINGGDVNMALRTEMEYLTRGHPSESVPASLGGEGARVCKPREIFRPNIRDAADRPRGGDRVHTSRAAKGSIWVTIPGNYDVG